jgi:hypothetical protein
VRRPCRYCNHISVNKGIELHGKAATDAVTAELRQLFRSKGAPVPILREELTASERRGIIRFSMFLKAKFSAQGIFEKVKARLVADGSQQDRELYPDNNSPTVAVPHLFSMLLIAAKEGRHVMKLDIGGAYLNAEMVGESVITEINKEITGIIRDVQPEVAPYIREGKLLVRLKKALYGCIQSAKLWYLKLQSVLERKGFEKNPMDACVRNKTWNGKQCTIAIYVDDLLVTCNDLSALEWVKSKLTAEFKEVSSEISNKFSYLGMGISIHDGTVTISMENWTREMLSEYSGSDVRKSPATGDLFNQKGSEELNAEEKRKFHKFTAKLLYLAKRIRADILTATSVLCTRVKKPTVEDRRKLDRIMGYLQGTISKSLVLHCDCDLGLIAHLDALFGCHLDGKSHTGVAIFLGGQACIQAISRKQKIVTKDSTEAELVALSDILNVVILLDEFLQHQGHGSTHAPVIMQDNTSTISLVTKGGDQIRNKHLRARQYIVKQAVDDKEVGVQHVRTDRMIADCLTKVVEDRQFEWATRQLLGDGSKVSGHKRQCDDRRGALSKMNVWGVTAGDANKEERLLWPGFEPTTLVALSFVCRWSRNQHK